MSWFPVQLPLLLTNSPHSYCGASQNLVWWDLGLFFFLVLPCQASNLTLGSSASSKLYSGWNLASGVRFNFPLLSRLFQLAFQGSLTQDLPSVWGPPVPAKNSCFFLGGNQHLNGSSSAREYLIMKVLPVAHTGFGGAEGLPHVSHPESSSPITCLVFITSPCLSLS